MKQGWSTEIASQMMVKMANFFESRYRNPAQPVAAQPVAAQPLAIVVQDVGEVVLATHKVWPNSFKKS